MNAISKDKPTPQDRWQEKNLKRYTISVNINTDNDVVKRLEKQANKSGYIVELVRKDIKENK